MKSQREILPPFPLGESIFESDSNGGEGHGEGTCLLRAGELISAHRYDFARTSLTFATYAAASC